MFKFAMFKFPKLHFVTLLLGAVVSFLVNAVALPSFQVRAWSQLSNVQTPIQSSGETAPEEFRPEVVVARALPALKNIAARPVSYANMIYKLLPEKYPDAENPHDSIYGTDDATDNNMEAPDAEGRVDRILRRLHGYEHTCFSYCTPSMFLVMFFVAEYLLVCWVMYTVRGMIVAASSASHGGKG